MTATVPPPPPPKLPSCVLILKNGVSVRVDGMSASWAKHMRRVKGEIRITGDDGQKMLVKGEDIRQIFPLKA